MTEGALFSHEIRRNVNAWIFKFRADAIRFGEDTNPENKSGADLKVLYRVWCEPTSLHRASVYMTFGLHNRLGESLGVFIERRYRLAARLRARILQPSVGEWNLEAFGGGFRMDKIGMPTLFCLLDLIAAGRVSISARLWPLRILGKTAAITTPEICSILSAVEGYNSSRWLLAGEQGGFRSTVVKFEPWERK